MPTQFVFIHNWVIMGFQWTVCWWLLVSLNLRHSTSNLLLLAREVGPWIHGPRQCPKLAYQGKKIHEFAHGKCFVFPFKNYYRTRSMFAFMSSLWWSFLPQFRGVILWGREKEREREREDQMIPIYACRL